MGRPKHIGQIIKEHYGGSDSYAAYLYSPEWQRKRTRILQQRGAKCEVCGIKHRLQVHHLTYARIFNELDTDLKVLCWACHEREHGIRGAII